MFHDVSLRYKIGLPMAVLGLALALLGYWLLSMQVSTLQTTFVEMLARERVSTARSAIDSAADMALKEAVMFSRQPEVIEAYQLAHSGNMDDPASPQSQAARERLRMLLAPVRGGLKDILGASFQLHYHLPNGRSLLRVWREKQAKKDGKWVDISDDLTSFRQTVLDINADPKPLKGIEPGRGGFAVRGLAPVFDKGHRPLGSVEMLVEFDTVLGPLQSEPGVSVMVFMNVEKLPITTQLQDPAKNPVIGDKYVFVSGQDTPEATIITPELLAAGAKDPVVRILGSRAVTVFPILDYQGRQVGLLALAQDISSSLAVISRLSKVLTAILAVLIALPLLVGVVVMQRVVFRPLGHIQGLVRRMADGDFSLRFHGSRK